MAILNTINISKTIALHVLGDADYPNESLRLAVVRRHSLKSSLLALIGLGKDDVLAEHGAVQRLVIYDSTIGDQEGVTIVAIDHHILYIDRQTGTVNMRTLESEVYTKDLWMVRRPSRLVVFRPVGDWCIHSVSRATATGIVSTERYMPLFTRDGRVDKGARVSIFSMTSGKYNLVRWRDSEGLDFRLFGDLTGAQERSLLEIDRNKLVMADFPRVKSGQLFKMNDYTSFEWYSEDV